MLLIANCYSPNCLFGPTNGPRNANMYSNFSNLVSHFLIYLQAEDFETAQRQITDQLQIISELRHQNLVSDELEDILIAQNFWYEIDFYIINISKDDHVLYKFCPDFLVVCN